MDVQEKPWYLHSLDVSLVTVFHTSDEKLRFHGEVSVANGVPYLNVYDETDKLKGLFDVSFGADYYFTKNIGAFVQVNNLFGNAYAHWDRYTVFGINGVAGVLVRI